jgi:hypothetical protein
MPAKRPLLLIETSILETLVNLLDEDRNLPLLEYWRRTGSVTLLVPEILREEFTRHRPKLLEKISKAVKEHSNSLKRGKLLKVEVDIPIEKEESAKATLEAQIDRVNLLLETGVQIKASDNMVTKAGWLLLNDKPPFKIKKDSMPDATILLSSLEYAIDQGYNEIYFTSSNTNEFGKDVLYPELAEIFPQLTIHYFTKLNDFVDALIKIGIPDEKQMKLDQKQSDFEVPINIDRDQPLEEQLCEYVEKRFANVRALPQRFFTRQYPFIQNWSNIQPSPFSLVTDNPDVFQILVRGPRKGFSRKRWTEMIKRLRFSLISDVVLNRGNAEPLAQVGERKKCNCPVCLEKRMDYAKLFATLKSGRAEKKKRAYALYRTGFRLEAAELYSELFNETDDLTVEKFIYALSISHLKHVGRFEYYSENDPDDRLNRIPSPDLETLYQKIKRADFVNEHLLIWLHDTMFYYDSLDKMTEASINIKDRYYNQNRGSTQSTRKMMEVFGGLEHFLRYNCLVYDMYGQFDRLMDLFFESMVASYGQGDYMGGKLKFVNDAITDLLLQYGDADRIERWMERYRQQKLEYKKSDENSGLIEKLMRLFTEYPKVVKVYQSLPFVKTSRFWNEYSEKIANGISLVASIDLPAAIVNQFARHLLIFLRTEKHLFTPEIEKRLKQFFEKKSDLVNEKLVSQYASYFIVSEHLRAFRNVENLVDLARKRKFKLILTKQAASAIHRTYLQAGDQGQFMSKWYMVADLVFVLENADLKASILTFFRDLMKSNFSGVGYYLLAVQSIIKPTDRYEKQFLKEVDIAIGKAEKFHRHPFYQGIVDTDPLVDQYLNYMFCFKKRIPTKQKRRIMAIDPYYEWLLNTEKFDYTRFNRKWLYHYATRYHNEHYKHSRKLKAWMLKEIKANFLDDDLPKTYMNIHYFTNS